MSALIGLLPPRWRLRGVATEYLLHHASAIAVPPLGARVRPLLLEQAVRALHADSPFEAETLRELFRAAARTPPGDVSWGEMVSVVVRSLHERTLVGLEVPAAVRYPALRPPSRHPPEPPKPPDETPRSMLSVQVTDASGKPVDDAEVALNAASAGTTKGGGQHTQGEVKPGVYDVEVLKPGFKRGKTRVTVADGASVTARVQLTRLKARLVFPASKANHKQYVNLAAATATPEDGHVLTVKIDVPDGKVGDKVYVRLDWDEKKVSPRDSPARGVGGGAEAKWCPQGGKELVLKKDGETLTVDLELGLAGGDVYTLAVGTTEDCADDRCEVTTWRKLWYEMMAPEVMGLKDDIGAAHRGRVDQLLQPCFVEYRVWKAHVFPDAAAPADTLFDAAYFSEAGRKRFVLTDHTFTLYPTTNGKWDAGKRPRSIGLRLCDRNYFNDSPEEELLQRTTTVGATFDVFQRKRRYVLPRSARSGVAAVKSVRWVAKVDAARFPRHPALDGGRPRSGTLSGTADVRFETIEKLTVKLPVGTDAAPGPGRFVGPASETRCPIEVRIKFEAADGGLGLAGQGAQAGENLVCYKDAAPQTTVDVMIHELCHSAGMAVIGGNTPPPGLPTPKTTGEADPHNLDGGSTRGHLYEGHDHSGGHCARGLTDAQKARLSYGGLPATCINFGESDLQDPSKRTQLICPTCARILKARELQSL